MFDWFRKNKIKVTKQTEQADSVFAEKAGEEEMSLYEYIRSNLSEDELSLSFSLPEEETGNGLRFADGAIDGMTMYHMMGKELDEEQKTRMQELVGFISDGAYEKADEALREFAGKNRALSLIDDFENYIKGNRANLNAVNIYRYGVKLIMESKDRECVKYGLEILELFHLKDEKVKEAVRILGLSNEFTLFAVFIMQQWENANEEIFRLARKVRGWGRIHAIEKLSPETEEIRKWLLKEGIKNDVMSEYSALTCFEKLDVPGMLEGELLREEFRGIGAILNALLHEGPVPGISAVENRKYVFEKYLEHAQKQSMTLKDYEVVLQIYLYYSDEKKKDENICRICQEIFSSEKCLKITEEAVKEGRGIELARQIGIDYRKPLWEGLRDDFHENYSYVRYLMDDEAYVDDVIDVFTKELPLAQMTTGPAEEMGLGRKFADFQKLDFILQELKDKVGKGEELMKTALKSPVIRNRNMAAAVLKVWVETAEKPLKEISPVLYDTVQEELEKEMREEVKTRMKEVNDYGKMA